MLFLSGVFRHLAPDQPLKKKRHTPCFVGAVLFLDEFSEPCLTSVFLHAPPFVGAQGHPYATGVIGCGAWQPAGAGFGPHGEPGCQVPGCADTWSGHSGDSQQGQALWGQSACSHTHCEVTPLSVLWHWCAPGSPVFCVFNGVPFTSKSSCTGSTFRFTSQASLGLFDRIHIHYRSCHMTAFIFTTNQVIGLHLHSLQNRSCDCIYVHYKNQIVWLLSYLLQIKSCDCCLIYYDSNHMFAFTFTANQVLWLQFHSLQIHITTSHVYDCVHIHSCQIVQVHCVCIVWQTLDRLLRMFMSWK